MREIFGVERSAVLWMACGLALVVMFCATASALDEGFEGMPTGVPPAGWNENYTLPGGTPVTRAEAAAQGVTVHVTDAVSFSGSQSLHFQDNSGSVGSEMYKSLSPASSIVFEYCVRSDDLTKEAVFVTLRGDGGNDLALGFGNAGGGGAAGYIGIINWNTGWVERYLMPYTEGTWYYVRRELNCWTNTGSFLVQDTTNPANWAFYSGGSGTPNTYIDMVRLITSNSQGADAYMDSVCVLLAIEIDIKPGSDPNSINLALNGVIPVALLGSEDFDVTEVDQSTLEFEGNAARTKGKSGNIGAFEDVDGDGYADLVVQFPAEGLALSETDTEATVIGSLLDGTPIIGTDSIRVVQPVD